MPTRCAGCWLSHAGPTPKSPWAGGASPSTTGAGRILLSGRSWQNPWAKKVPTMDAGHGSGIGPSHSFSQRPCPQPCLPSQRCVIISPHYPSSTRGILLNMAQVYHSDIATVSKFHMQHQATFWRRTAQANFDEDCARFLDDGGRSHTSQGADPSIDISNRCP